ncbi:MAG: CBS domain-containing protein [Verrucomicrobiota bacterium]
MQIKEIMTPNPLYLKPDTKLHEAAQKMRELDIGLIPIGDGNKLQGMLTDRDITVRAVAEGKNPQTTSVSEVMSGEVFYCFEDQELEDAVETMEKQQVRRLIILDRDKMMTGVVSLGDLATRVSERAPEARALEGVSQSG